MKSQDLCEQVTATIIAELEKGVNETKIHEAAVEQKLDDMVESLHNIEKHMK